MKRILVIFTALFLIFQTSFAQDVKFGIKVGLTGGLFNAQMSDIKLKTKPNFSIQAGIEVDVPFSSYFSFRTGLSFVQKAAEVSYTNNLHADTNVSMVQRFNNLELPVYIVGRIEFSNESAVYLGVGPSVTVAMTGRLEIGKQLVTTPETTFDVREKMSFKKDNGSLYNSFNRWDVGINVFLSYKFAQGFTISANYNKGLLNLTKIENHKYSSGYIGLTLGFMMGN
ncbi:hypothetical protein FACS1894178_2830 [Bacteroidia bacterium]|nr:hypothetical protein FACS1894178_2830 [Bacteroidia bacterium]